MNRNEQLIKDMKPGERTSKNKNQDAVLEQELTAVAKSILPTKRHLSYFEREQAHNLGKTVDSHGNIDLSEGSNSISIQQNNNNSRRVNPNAHASTTDAFSPGVAEILDVGKAEGSLHAGDYPEGDLGRHMRYCQEPGRTHCSVCKGQGIAALKKQRQSSNQARHCLPGE